MQVKVVALVAGVAVLFAALPAFSQTSDEAVADSLVLTPAWAKLDALLKAGIARRLVDLRVRAEQGDAEAQLRLGLMYFTGDGVPADDVEAVRWFRLAAEQGDNTAQYNLGIMYANGEGVLKDDVQAAQWYRLAAEQGHAGAQHNLGILYANGEGVLKDSVLAHMWFNIASANGADNAGENRDTTERDMTRAEITRATELARACMASGYQSCEP